MKTTKKLEVPSVKARNFNPSNRNRVIRPAKGGGYRRKARNGRGDE